MINYRTKAGREQTHSKGIKFGRPSLNTKNGYFIVRKRVLELRNKGLIARASAKTIEC